jgi:hypothetical protein
MAYSLGIKRCWFHKNHYDIPKRRVAEITTYCQVVTSKEIVNIIKNNLDGNSVIKNEKLRVGACNSTPSGYIGR